MENFPQTFFVGGMVRDLMLNKKVVDIDLATEAKPTAIVKILGHEGVKYDAHFARFGNILAGNKPNQVAITTFRKDLPSNGRYPKVIFTKSPKIDSQRRDFTINALYLSLKTKKILDFHHGLKDLGTKTIRFIGNPVNRINQDPLRILRALRFALTLNFKFEKKTFTALGENLSKIERLSQNKINSEIAKIPNERNKKTFLEFISAKNRLTKF